MMRPEKFGPNIKKILDALGMTQAELAYNAGLTQAAISQILAGKREPSLSSICLILSVIPVKFEKLVSP